MAMEDLAMEDLAMEDLAMEDLAMFKIEQRGVALHCRCPMRG
jgi:hypothetical protein